MHEPQRVWAEGLEELVADGGGARVGLTLQEEDAGVAVQRDQGAPELVEAYVLGEHILAGPAGAASGTPGDGPDLAAVHGEPEAVALAA